MNDICGKGVLGDDDHIRLIDAIWSAQGKAHPLQSSCGTGVSALSGIVLVFDRITSEYKAYWGSFCLPTNCFDRDVLEDARFVAMFGNRMPESTIQALFPGVTSLARPVQEAA